MPNSRLQASLTRALAELKSERSRLDSAIAQLEGFIASLAKLGRRGPGRPPGSGQKRTPKWSPAARKAAAERMRRYWAARRGGKAASS